MRKYFVVLMSMALLASAMASRAYSSQMPQCELTAANFIEKVIPGERIMETVRCVKGNDLINRSPLWACTLTVKGDSHTLYKVVMPVSSLDENEIPTCAPPTSVFSIQRGHR